MVETISRGEVVLNFIYDEVDQHLNPNGDECWHCGGEGTTYDCIDGCCADAESGCEQCEMPCLECKLHAGRRARAVREEVIKSNDVDVAVTWLKEIGRWHDGITADQIKVQLAEAYSAQSPAQRTAVENKGDGQSFSDEKSVIPETGFSG